MKLLIKTLIHIWAVP